MFGRSVRPTKSERIRALPGDEFLPKPSGLITDAITIRWPPRIVWPWLVQMGAGRAGWYSYDFIDNAGHRSADRIVPEFQTIQDAIVIFEQEKKKIIAAEP